MNRNSKLLLATLLCATFMLSCKPNVYAHINAPVRTTVTLSKSVEGNYYDNEIKFEQMDMLMKSLKDFKIKVEDISIKKLKIYLKSSDVPSIFDNENIQIQVKVSYIKNESEIDNDQSRDEVLTIVTTFGKFRTQTMGYYNDDNGCSLLIRKFQTAFVINMLKINELCVFLHENCSH